MFDPEKDNVVSEMNSLPQLENEQSLEDYKMLDGVNFLSPRPC